MSEVPATSQAGQPVTTKNNLLENLKKPIPTSKETAATHPKEKHSSEFEAYHNELKAEIVKPPLSKNDKKDCKSVMWGKGTEIHYQTDLYASVKLFFFESPDFNHAVKYSTGWLDDGWHWQFPDEIFIVEVWTVGASVPEWNQDKQKERYVPVEDHWIRDGIIQLRYDRSGLRCWNDYITANFEKASS